MLSSKAPLDVQFPTPREGDETISEHRRQRWIPAVISVILVAAWSAGMPGAASAAVQTLPAVADSHVQSGSPTRNYGTTVDLRVRAPSPEYRSYIAFDASALSGTVTSAILRV